MVRKIDELTLGNHFFLTADDICYYLGHMILRISPC